MSFDLNGKAALVTGAGSGISLEFARKLLESGTNVVFADLTLTPAAQSIVEKFNEKRKRAVFVQTDVTDWKQITAAFDKAMEEFGRLDVVCPGAGIFDPPSHRFWDLQSSESSSFKTIDINLTHPIRCTQLAIDYFLRQKLDRAVVILLSSSAAQFATPLVPLYSACKAGLSHFVRQMEFLEPANNIRIVAVAPGMVQTPLWTVAQRDGLLDEKKGDVWVSPARVAEVMVDVSTKPDQGMGGTVWEITANNVRKIEMLNDPGPDMTADGMRMSNMDLAYAELEAGMKNFGK